MKVGQITDQQDIKTNYYAVSKPVIVLNDWTKFFSKQKSIRMDSHYCKTHITTGQNKFYCLPGKVSYNWLWKSKSPTRNGKHVSFNHYTTQVYLLGTTSSKRMIFYWVSKALWVSRKCSISIPYIPWKSLWGHFGFKCFHPSPLNCYIREKFINLF